MRDVKQIENLPARGRDKSVKEKKHKHHPEEEKSRGRDNVKTNDSVRKGSEQTRSYLEESRSKEDGHGAIARKTEVEDLFHNHQRLTSTH